MTKFLSLGVIYLQLVTTDSEDETEAGHIRWSTRSEDNLLLSNIVGFNKDSMAYQGQYGIPGYNKGPKQDLEKHSDKELIVTAVGVLISFVDAPLSN